MMRVRYGDVWADWAYGSTFVVVPTNIGWRMSGDGVMGRGMARQAADRCPELPAWYGGQCQAYRQDTPVMLYPPGRMILFPTKPLEDATPWLSWKRDANVKLLWRSAAQLAAFCCAETIAVPLVGCGEGGLSADLVLPILRTFLSHYRFELVVPESLRASVEGIIFGKWDRWLLYDDPRPGPHGSPHGTHWNDA